MAPRGFFSPLLPFLPFPCSVLAGILRSVLFIDGANWFHGLRSIRVDSGRLDYRRVARKLLIDRDLKEIRYYVGRVRGDLARMRGQERFLRRLRSQDVQVYLGRIERNITYPSDSPVAEKIRKLVVRHEATLPGSLADELLAVCEMAIPHYVEKQVDVRIAVDLVSGAVSDDYDVAYLLSSDGDFVPAVEQARKAGKTVFAASVSPGQQLARSVDSFIRLDKAWFRGLDPDRGDSS